MRQRYVSFAGKVFLAAFLFLSIADGFAQKQYKMAYGRQGTIVYNHDTAEFTVTYNGEQIFSNAGAVFTINGKNIKSSDYKIAELSKENFTDALGKGVKYIAAYKEKGLPDALQIFYTYTDKPYFLTQVEIKGNAIETNYISPIAKAQVNFDDAKSLNTVFVPFDNDAFISYDSKPVSAIKESNSAEVGILFNNTTRNGLIVASLEHTIWKSAVQTENAAGSVNINAWAGYTEKTVTRDTIAHGMVKGDKVVSPKMFVGYFADWRKGMDEFAKANRLIEPPFVKNWDKPTPVGWNSWGVLMDKITPENTKAVTNFFADSIPQFRVGNTAYIDLDSFWDNFDRGSNDMIKLKEFADYCKSKGLEPGVYWAPFTDWGWKDGPKRKVEGTNYTFGELWTKVGKGYFEFDGALAIDPTHPGTLKRVDIMIGKLKACGFKMIKIDFLGHAAAESTSFYDKNITTGMQAYRVGMEHLVKALDGQMLIYAAISPSLATSRYAHMRRIACDAWKTIEQTQYTLNSVNYGWWQTYTYNYIDADHVVFADETEGENRARLISAVITGTLITGDDYSKHGNWSKKAKEWLGNKELLKIVSNGKAFLPVEGNTGTKTSETFIRQIGNDWYLAVFNYGVEAKKYNLQLERLGISRGLYNLTDVFTGKVIKTTGDEIIVTLGPKDGQLYKIVR